MKTFRLAIQNLDQNIEVLPVVLQLSWTHAFGPVAFLEVSDSIQPLIMQMKNLDLSPCGQNSVVEPT